MTHARHRAGCAALSRIPGVVVSGRTLRKSHTYFSSRWGNVLSPYWMARAMAELGGFACAAHAPPTPAHRSADSNASPQPRSAVRRYTGAAFGRGTWMEHLPSSAPAVPARSRLYEEACRACPRVNLEYGAVAVPSIVPLHVGPCAPVSLSLISSVIPRRARWPFTGSGVATPSAMGPSQQHMPQPIDTCDPACAQRTSASPAGRTSCPPYAATPPPPCACTACATASLCRGTSRVTT